MAPTTSARNASPAQRVVKKPQEDVAKQNPATPKAAPKKTQPKKTRNASPAPLAAKKEVAEHEQLKKEVQEKPQKQIEPEPKGDSEIHAVGKRLSFRRKITLAAILMMLIAGVVLQTVYPGEVAEISTKLRSGVAKVSTRLGSGVAEVATKLGSRVAEVSTNLGSGVAEVSTKFGGRVAEVSTKFGGRVAEVSNQLQIVTSKALSEIYLRFSSRTTKPEQTTADL